MEKAKKILMKSHDLKVINGKVMSVPLNDEEFEYAKQKGIMFPYRKTIQHDECLERIRNVLAQLTPEAVANAFLYSLSTRALEYRSALGSYWYAKAIPAHECRANCSTCEICCWDGYNDMPCSKEYKNEYNTFSYDRYKYGGVLHTHAQYALFDLEEFVKLPRVEHTEEDESILSGILSCVDLLEPSNKAGGLQKMITSRKILKSNKNEISILLDILGVCGILENEEHHCYDEGFFDCINRDPPELTNDYAYPVNWWRAGDGINKKRFEIVFGKSYGSFIAESGVSRKSSASADS